MNFKLNIPSLCLLLLSLVYVSCTKDEVQAQNSIIGDWTVTEITSIYGEFFDNGFNPIETVSEQGTLGNFTFEEETVNFTFMRNDTLFTGTSTWDIRAEKVNAGFTKVTEFTLTIENEFVFDVVFEDGTFNSEKDAQEITFTNNPNNGPGVSINMVLEKN